jgi:hypothetical protein
MKKLIFILTLLLFCENCPAYTYKDFKNLYTLVNGMLVSPSASARTIGKNILRTGISGYYYCFKKLQNGELYFPIDYFRSTNQDALINFIIEYGIFKNSEIDLLIPYAPDWHPNRGGNKQGIADIAIIFKQYLLTYYNIDMGLTACYKLNTSTFADDPTWYGTNYSTIVLKAIFSTRYKKVSPFINIGYKNILGSGKIKSYEQNIDFTYSNTYIGAIGLNYQLLRTFEISLESNFESHNKKGISAYYLDICGGINLNLTKNIICYGKIGKNISDFAPYFYISTGISVVTKL